MTHVFNAATDNHYNNNNNNTAIFWQSDRSQIEDNHMIVQSLQKIETCFSSRLLRWVWSKICQCVAYRFQRTKIGVQERRGQLLQLIRRNNRLCVRSFALCEARKIAKWVWSVALFQLGPIALCNYLGLRGVVKIGGGDVSLTFPKEFVQLIDQERFDIVRICLCRQIWTICG